jgi:DNA invertase Pin-like site-specific DNA recombinase
MKAKYVRISTANQKTERQLVNENEFDFVYIDVISGSVPFGERPEALKLLNNDAVTSVTIGEVTRLGRNLGDILNTLETFTNKGVNLNIENLGLQTILPNGKPNPTASLMINLLASIGQYERDLINERTQQGREVAKFKGDVYKGRKRGAVAKGSKYYAKHFTEIISVQKLLNKGVSINMVAETLNINRGLIYAFIKKGFVQRPDKKDLFSTADKPITKNEKKLSNFKN